MGKKIICCLLAVWFIFSCLGCARIQVQDETTVATVPETTEETVPVTVPEDGDPENVTCQGSYSHAGKTDAVVGRIGDEILTNGQLAVWYWAEVASYCQSGAAIQPDYNQGLDTQGCEIDDSVNSWQQYFLQLALDRWHTAQALVLQGEDEGLPVEEAHQPDPVKYETYLVDTPATKYLYRYEKSFTPNTMHQAYLDGMPQMLAELGGEKGYADLAALAQEGFGSTEKNLLHWADLLNRGYMYFTNLSYFIEVTEDEIQECAEASEGKTVDIRVIRVDSSKGSAEKLLAQWKRGHYVTEATFADMARKNSDDEGSCINGGAYKEIRKGQLEPELENWCFAEGRKVGDTTVLSSGGSSYILYFSGSKTLGEAEAEEQLTAEKQTAILTEAREKYPMEVDYSLIALPQGEGALATEEVLYSDVAHERFPEVPLYLQANYSTSKYGKYRLSTHGCGITSMAMLASYMTDDELTPAELAARYGNYCYSNGTDGSLFVNEPPAMGFYLKGRCFDYNQAKRALKDGYIVVVSESAGYWTRGGHFLVLESIDENDMVTVRDSNIFNYQKLTGFREDAHPWEKIFPWGKAYWVFEKKITTIPACSRCGESKGEGVLAESYLCEKCVPAIARRDSYLAN